MNRNIVQQTYCLSKRKKWWVIEAATKYQMQVVNYKYCEHKTANNLCVRFQRIALNIENLLPDTLHYKLFRTEFVWEGSGGSNKVQACNNMIISCAFLNLCLLVKTSLWSSFWSHCWAHSSKQRKIKQYICRFALIYMGVIILFYLQ